MNIPEELKYTKDHEWISIDGEIATVGITDFAQRELGDIVYVEVETIGETLDADEVFGTVEAVKFIEFNEYLEDSPEDVNAEPYSKGWIIKMKVSDPDDLNHLLDSNQYRELIGE